jgi:hypothetical protein
LCSTPLDAADLHIVELWIQNYDVEELLKGKHVTVLTRKLSKLWPNDDQLRLVNVVSMATKTGRVPVPAIPGLDIKDGYVQNSYLKIRFCAASMLGWGIWKHALTVCVYIEYELQVFSAQL